MGIYHLVGNWRHSQKMQLFVCGLDFWKKQIIKEEENEFTFFLGSTVILTYYSEGYCQSLILKMKVDSDIKKLLKNIDFSV